MGKTLDEMVSALPARRRRKIQVRTEELITEEMTLRELRKAMGKTQAQIAKQIGKPQATISRMEAQSDMLLSNLDQVVGALGGRVRILAELPGRAPVELAGFSDIAPAARHVPRERAGGASVTVTARGAARLKKVVKEEPEVVTRVPRWRKSMTTQCYTKQTCRNPAE